MEKKELQKYVNKLRMMYDYAESDKQLIELSEDEIKALKIAADVMQEKCDSLKK